MAGGAARKASGAPPLVSCVVIFGFEVQSVSLLNLGREACEHQI